MSELHSGGVKLIVHRMVTGGVAIVFLTCAGYLFWAWYRCDLWDIAHDASWPHGFPYPDKGLMALEHYFDRANPRPGAIKMAGEFARVQKATSLAAALCGTAGVICGLPTVFHFIRRISNRRGFPIPCKQSPIE
jgi:hypothetical protein